MKATRRMTETGSAAIWRHYGAIAIACANTINAA
jgi:hypothetical protein